MRFPWMLSPVFSPDGGAGSGGEGAGGDAGSDGGDGGSVADLLYPDDAGEKGGDAGGDAGGDGDGADDKGKSGDGEGSEDDKSGKDGDGKDGDDKDKKDDDKSDDPADQVPEDGKYDLQMPEGVELDAEMAEALGPEFQGLGLTNGQAQKLADKFIEVQQKRAQEQGERWGETVQGWATEAQNDKEMGGDKWDDTIDSAKRAVDNLGTPELKKHLLESGSGNHPELIRFCAKVGRLIKEDDPATGGAEGQGKPVDTAHRLFPEDAPKG